MAGTKRPSFLKSQKEQKRKMKAQEKREAKANKRARAAENPGQGAPIEEFMPEEGAEMDAPADTAEPNG